MNKAGIYRIHFGGSKSYIGSTVNLSRRKHEHISRLSKGYSNLKKLQRAFNKYGLDLMVFEVLETCKISELFSKEDLYIQKFDAVNTGYNISKSTVMPMLGRNHSEETKKKMSIKAIGNKGRLGHTLTEEHKLKCSASLKGVGLGVSINLGSSNPSCKLSEDEVKQIKELKGIVSQSKLSKRFGVSQQQISKIHTGKRWKII